MFLYCLKSEKNLNARHENENNHAASSHTFFYSITQPYDEKFYVCTWFYGFSSLHFGINTPGWMIFSHFFSCITGSMLVMTVII